MSNLTIMWHTISYVSTCDKNLKDIDIHNLLNFVKEHNNNNNITGILMYSEGNFFQIIEGEKKTIIDLFEKIKLDSRHYNIIKIFSRESSNKAFSEYDSSFIIVGDTLDSSTEFRSFLLREKQQNSDGFKNISYLARKFMKLP